MNIEVVKSIFGAVAMPSVILEKKSNLIPALRKEIIPSRNFRVLTIKSK